MVMINNNHKTEIEKTRSSNNSNKEFHSRMIKMKRVAMERDYETYLIVTIYKGNGIDDNLLPHNLPVNRRIYSLVFWVQPGMEFRTREVIGNPDPIWNEEYYLIMNKSSMDAGFLHVEVLRSQSTSDPRTSSGKALVGRARIPLPRKFECKTGRFGLVRLEGSGCKAEGRVEVSIKWQKIYKH